MKKPTTYRLRNWNPYTNALKQRGSLTFHFADEVTQGWLNPNQTGKPDASNTYSDLAIQACRSIKVVFRLPLRQAQGFVQSVLGLLGLDLPARDYSTLSRRQSHLRVPLPRSGSRDEPIHVVIDSTGLKVFGEGERQVKKHGASIRGERSSPERRTWRKLHLGVDEATGEIVAVVTTVADGTAFPNVLAQVEPPVKQCSCDGAYNWWQIWEAIAAHGALATIPPCLGAVIRQHGNCKAAAPLPRDEALRAVRQGGWHRWKAESGYSRRSLVETAMMRQKVLFGAGLSSRSLARQSVECRVRCAVLNRFTALGCPTVTPARLRLRRGVRSEPERRPTRAGAWTEHTPRRARGPATGSHACERAASVSPPR